MGSSGHQAPARKGMCGLGWGGTGVKESVLAWVGTVLGHQGSRGGGGWGEASRRSMLGPLTYTARVHPHTS